MLKKAAGTILTQMENIDFGNRQWLSSQMGFVLFISILGLIYIANARVAEKTMSEIKVAQQTLQELRWEYLTNKSQLMYGTKQKEIVKIARDYGLKEMTTSPMKMVINDHNKVEQEP